MSSEPATAGSRASGARQRDLGRVALPFREGADHHGWHPLAGQKNTWLLSMFITVFEGGFFILRDKTIDTPLINWLLCSFTRENTPSFDGVFSLVTLAQSIYKELVDEIIRWNDILSGVKHREAAAF